jgi:predicted RNA-binding protein with PUA-like domain
VRNFQARNFMRDDMAPGDGVLYYHSNAAPPSIAGVAEVARAAYPDPTQFDPESEYFDPRASPDAPIWMQVDIRAIEALPRPLALDELRTVGALRGMELLRKGSRLSVQPVTADEWAAVMELGARAPRLPEPRRARRKPS